MSRFAIDPQWLSGQLDLPEEAATLAALRIEIDGNLRTRLYHRLRATERDRVHVPTYPLACGLVRLWWSMLHEPRRDGMSGAAAATRHRLDALTPGYLFPPLEIWSAGADWVNVAAPSQEPEPVPLTHAEFLAPPLAAGKFVARDEVAAILSDLIEATLGRIGCCQADPDALAAGWDRVRASLADPEEAAFCRAAGRLGLDPYDPDIPDLERCAEGLPETLFDTLCEAVVVEDLPAATELARAAIRDLGDTHGAILDVGTLGDCPHADPNIPAWEDGYRGAHEARRRLGLDARPCQAADTLFGQVGRYARLNAGTLAAVEGILRRTGGRIRTRVTYRSAAQARFRLGRALYLGWRTADGDASAITIARTRDQQASRAFAAELLAPAALLTERAGRYGLATDQIDDLARELGCSAQIIRDQAWNHHIPIV